MHIAIWNGLDHSSGLTHILMVIMYNEHGKPVYCTQQRAQQGMVLIGMSIIKP